MSEITTPLTPETPTPEIATPPAPEIATPPAPETITPFPDTGEFVRAFPNSKFPNQFILADAKGVVFAITPGIDKARLVYEAVNTYFAAIQMRQMQELCNLEQSERRIISL